jgi:hypothetical protein
MKRYGLEGRCIDSGSLELGNPADPKLLVFKVQQVQPLIRLFHGFAR